MEKSNHKGIDSKKEVEKHFANKLTCQQVRKFSDQLYALMPYENGGKCFFCDFPRSNAKDFFADVKYWLGNHIGVYIWSFKYEEGL